MIALVKTDSLTELIKSGNISEIKQMIETKKKALAEAVENADFYKSIGNDEFASSELARVNLLTRQIDKLEKTL